MESNAKTKLFFRLYNTVHARLYTYLLVIVHNHVDAEDILQETATVMWEKFEQFEQGTNFEAWAVSIAKNKALEFLRRNKKSKMIFNEYSYETISNRAQHATEDVSDRLSVVNSCLKKLPEKDLKLVLLRFRDNISLKQISNQIGRSPSGICQSFSRILKTIQSCVTSVLAQQEI